VSKGERKATMVYLRPDAWRAVKIRAMDRGTSMTVEIEQAVDRYLAEEERPALEASAH
jgi:plasmid stability protein